MNDRFLRINDKEFSFEEVAKALGVELHEEADAENFLLCQRVDAGVLTARISDFGSESGIDVELHLPEMEKTQPISITRTEQPRGDGETNNVRTLSYGRDKEYFMYFDTDIRPDREVTEKKRPPSVVISGNPGLSVDVWTENPYMNYKGRIVPLDVEMDIIHKENVDSAGKSPAKSLDAQIAGARSRAEANVGIATEKPEKDLNR